MLVDPDNQYRYLEIRGRVVERTTDGADEHINKMAKKYLNQDVYPFRSPSEVRVISKLGQQQGLCLRRPQPPACLPLEPR